MSSQIYWRTSNFPSLLIEKWEDGFTVFQPDSGKTHFLDPIAMRVLQALHSAPNGMLAADVFNACLLFRSESAANSRFGAEVSAALGQLDELGLIEPLSRGLPGDR